MRQRRFKQVDVFTTRPFAGNPLAVVLDAEGLEAEQMQRIARWTNLSETVFLLPSTRGSYLARIFTPNHELPFAGHPTIGAAHAVLEAGLWGASAEGLVQECGLGLVALRRGARGEILARLPMPRLREGEVDAEALTRAAGGLALAEPAVFDIGPVWLVARARDAEALAAARPDNDALIALSHTLAVGGLSVYAHDARGAVHVRSFAPADSIPEDPVCGSGNACVAAHMRHVGLAAVGHRHVAHQGAALGRDGRVEVHLGDDHLDLGGHAVTVIEGTILA